MVITILEGSVPEDKWQDLQEAYGSLDKDDPNNPTGSYLVQNKDKPNTWRIISIWKDMEALQKMRSSERTPKGVVLFQNIDVKPSLSIFDVKDVF